MHPWFPVILFAAASGYGVCMVRRPEQAVRHSTRTWTSSRKNGDGRPSARLVAYTGRFGWVLTPTTLVCAVATAVHAARR